MVDLKNKVALVTGASSGIGKAIAIELLKQGCKLILNGRNRKKIRNTIFEEQEYKDQITFVEADLMTDQGLNLLIEEVNKDTKQIDILIHSAGLIHVGSTATSTVAQFDEQYKLNVRAPYVLTQHFMDNVIAHKGQMVFINSTAGLDSWANVGQYAATKHALRAWVNSLRAELLGSGVKIINVFPGATDTPMQRYIQEVNNKVYHADEFVPAAQLADIVVRALKVPDVTVVSDIVVKPLHYDPKPENNKIL